MYVEHCVNYQLTLVHNFDIRQHENHCETGNEGGGAQSGFKI